MTDKKYNMFMKMTIDEMIDALMAMKEKVGGAEAVPFMLPYGENDYVIPSYPVVCELEDQDGNEFKCAFIGNVGGEELTVKGMPHYDWNPSKNEFKYETTGPEQHRNVLRVKMKYAYPKDAIVNGNRDSEVKPEIPGYDKDDDESIKWNIDVDTGKILNWKDGITAKTNYKIVDSFEYLFDSFKYEGYVPDFMGICDESFGDYVCVEINEKGFIDNWSKDRFLKEMKKHKKLASNEESEDED